MSHVQIDANRRDKLAKLFYSVCRGKTAISIDNATQFLEAVYTDPNIIACLNGLVNSKHGAGLAALQYALQMDMSPTFFLQSPHWAALITYLQPPGIELRALDGGELFKKIITAIVDPPSLWNAYCNPFEDGDMDNDETSMQRFAWLFSQVITLPSDLACRDAEETSDLLDHLLSKSSPFPSVHSIAQNISSIIRGTSTSTADPTAGPGGRHSNDLVDFRDISIVPTADEVECTAQPFLRKSDALEKPGNETTRELEYLDNLFRLLREDMLYEMREELQIATGRTKGRKHRGTVLHGLLPAGIHCGESDKQRRRWCMMFECSLKGQLGPEWDKLDVKEAAKRKKVLEDHQHRRFLKDRSLCCLLLDNKLFAFATIQRNEKLLAQEVSKVVLQIQSRRSSHDTLLKLKAAFSRGGPPPNVTLIQIEAALFAFEPTLLALQNMHSVPLKEEIVFWNSAPTNSSSTSFPAGPGPGGFWNWSSSPSSSTSTTASPRLVDLTPNPLLEDLVMRLRRDPRTDLQRPLQLSKSIILDGAQSDSFLAGLTQRVSLIQGPPGTGKSFIGALLAKAIHKFTNHTILVVCYTNHALDQFLEDLLNIGIPENEMLRLGGRPNEKTQSMSIRNKPRAPRGTIDGHKVGNLKTESEALLQSAMQSFREYEASSVGNLQVLLHLEFEDPEFYKALRTPDPDLEGDGMTLVGKHGRAVTQDYLLERWMSGQDQGLFNRLFKSVSSSVDASVTGARARVWAMSASERMRKVAEWQDAIIRDHVDRLHRSLLAYDKSQDSLMAEFDANDVAVMKSSRIIACTTTGAAMNFNKLRQAPAQVLLVEEAGEILESHVITSLGADSEQMILIGDHKQLRPKVNNYELTVEKENGFDLNRSLFERLVLKDYPHQILVQQHRMQPEVSSLVRLLTYPDLVDASRTQNRPPLKGVPDTVVFVNHAQLEGDLPGIGDRKDQGAKTSKKNKFEVDMVYKIVRYLLQQGYKPEEMVVLTPYLGQLTELRKELQSEVNAMLNDLDAGELARAGLLTNSNVRGEDLRELRLATIDNYQGEESDIVIISLTRSNPGKDIGFMYSPERLNVLLSRAKNAMIIVGNASTFTGSRKGGAIWGKMVSHLREKNHFYEGFPVRCQKHPQKTRLLAVPIDFERECPNGGCEENCAVTLNCGVHQCPLKCHPVSDHAKVPCTAVVPNTCPVGHKNDYQCSKNPPTTCKTCDKEAKRLQQQQEAQFRRQQQLERAKDEHQRHLDAVEEQILAEQQKIKDKQLEHDRQVALEQKKKDLAAARDAAESFTPTATSTSTGSGSSFSSFFLHSFFSSASTPSTAHTGSSSSGNTPNPGPANSTPPPNSNPPNSNPSNSSSSNQPPSSSSVPAFTTASTPNNASFVLPTSPAETEWQHRRNVYGANNAAIDAMMQLTGLEDVKRKILDLLDKIELAKRQNASLKDERFNIALLGNPGTGKTTVARFYADFLISQDLLDGKGWFETTGSLMATNGVAGAEKEVKNLLGQGGGAMFIDEAYQLVSKGNISGGQVLDYLLAEMENNVGKLVFILAGYNKEMQEFFEHNPGLPSRVPHTIQFADYTDAELMVMMHAKLAKRFKGRIQVDDGIGGLYMRIAIRRLGRGRGTKGFGNARALEILLQKITDRQAARIGKSKRAGNSENDLLLKMVDVVGPNPSEVLPDCQAWKELKGMIGLASVKKSVEDLFDIIEINYQRELKEEKPLNLTFNRVFLGSPGTGKTTVGKLYGQILADLGLLSNGEVVIKNPSDFIGAYLGQSESNTKKILQSTVGKVLIIDEAYMLYGGGSKSGGSTTNSFNTSVIDTIVAEVQSVPGEDRCVLLLGYEAQMEDMFQNVNPGLSRRFASEDAFRFEDFNDSELMQIMDIKMAKQDLRATDRAKEVAIEVLSRERNRPNFGNGGAVENLLVRAKLRYTPRVKKDPGALLEPLDFDPDFDRHLKASENLDKLFSDLTGFKDVIGKLRGYQKIARVAKERGTDARKLIPTNFIFKGPPGTGKTTVARKFGQVYYDMGFLSTVDVYECSATDLVGEYVGHTGPKTQKVFDKALGRVLFVDEAYRLGAAGGRFAQEAVDEMVTLLTQPKYFQKIVVILAGYEDDMNQLLKINNGLSSRFPEEVFFQHFDSPACLEILANQLAKESVSLPELLDTTRSGYKDMSKMVDQLRSAPAWGNARDMITISKNMINAALCSLPDGADPSTSLSISLQEGLSIMRTLLQERRDRAEASASGSNSPPPTSTSSSSMSAKPPAPPPPPPPSAPPAAPPSAPPTAPPSAPTSPQAPRTAPSQASPGPQLPPQQIPRAPRNQPRSISQNHHPQSPPQSPTSPTRGTGAQRSRRGQNRSGGNPFSLTLPTSPVRPNNVRPSRTPPVSGTTATASPISTALSLPSPPPRTSTLPSQASGQISAVDGAIRDQGVSKHVWNKLEAAKRAKREAERKAAQELAEARVVERAAAEQAAREREAAAAAALAERQARDAAEQAQRQKALDEARERERKAKEQKARIEREMKERRDRIAREMAEEQRKQRKLRNMGVCVQGFQWIKQGAGYQCAGGSHFIHDSQLW